MAHNDSKIKVIAIKAIVATRGFPVRRNKLVIQF